jgi:hypothetical protein
MIRLRDVASRRRGRGRGVAERQRARRIRYLLWDRTNGMLVVGGFRHTVETLSVHEGTCPANLGR